MTEELNLERLELRYRLVACSEGEMYHDEAARMIIRTDFPRLIAEVRKLRDWQKRAAEVLEGLNTCPRYPDFATVPRCGIEEAPEHVVFNVSVGYPRLMAIALLLSELPKAPDGD